MALINPPVHTLQYYPTCLNVDSVPENTYELDEINQCFQVNQGNQGSPIIFRAIFCFINPDY
jgi:hypothetical protein